MKKFWKWIRYVGGFIVLLSVIVYVTFLGYYWLLNKRAKARLQDKPLLEVDGQRFRDLNANGKLDIYEDSRQPIEARVENLLAQMTLEEKIGMFWHPPVGIGNRGKILKKPAMLSPESTYHLLVNQNVRHVNLFEVPSAKFVARWNNRIQKIAERDRLGIPVTISSDPRSGVHNFLSHNLLEGGYSKWPEPIGLAALNDSATTYRYAQVVSHELRSVGIKTALHPMADLATEPRWARVNGTFGEDAQLAAAMTSLYIKGFQGEQIGPNSVACMTKHWPGGGPQEHGEDAHFDYGKNQVYPGNNFDYHLIPFKAAINAGTAMMMPYYGIPLDQTDENVGMSFNKYVVNELLRKEHGYDGVICSDWGIIEGFSFAGFEIVQPKHWGVEHLSNEDKIVKALNAGIDQFGGDNNGDELTNAINNGKVTEARLDQSVRRLLKVKFQVGLFDNPYVDEDIAASVVGKESYMKEGAMAQKKAMVLLKNSQQILPLEEGIKIYIERIDLETAAKFANIVESPEQADVALIRLSTPFQSRNNDYVERFFHQGSLAFEQEEIDRLTSLAATVPTIFFIYMDRPTVMSEIDEAAAGLVAEFGALDDAILDVAFGRTHPKGRLPFEIPSSMEAVNAQFEDVPYDSKEPLYQFGHGLDY